MATMPLDSNPQLVQCLTAFAEFQSTAQEICQATLGPKDPHVLRILKELEEELAVYERQTHAEAGTLRKVAAARRARRAKWKVKHRKKAA
jgi:hypothetical protein